MYVKYSAWNYAKIYPYPFKYHYKYQILYKQLMPKAKLKSMRKNKHY